MHYTVFACDWCGFEERRTGHWDGGEQVHTVKDRVVHCDLGGQSVAVHIVHLGVSFLQWPRVPMLCDRCTLQFRAQLSRQVLESSSSSLNSSSEESHVTQGE